MNNKLSKKLLAFFIATIAIVSTCFVVANAENKERVRETYLRFSSNFLSSYDDLWEYEHLGFRYRDSSCAVANASFDIHVRRYNSPSSIIYKTVASFEYLPAIMAANTWCGGMWNYVIDGYPPYAYRNYFKIRNNNGNQIHAKYVELINRNYIAES